MDERYKYFNVCGQHIDNIKYNNEELNIKNDNKKSNLIKNNKEYENNSMNKENKKTINFINVYQMISYKNNNK